MRALLLLLLGGGLIWAVLTIFPRTDEGGPLDGGAPSQGGELVQPKNDEAVGGAVEPAAGGLQEASAPEQPAPVESGPAGGSDSGFPTQDTGSGGLSMPVGKADLIELGELVVHRDAKAVADWLTVSDGLLGSDLEAAVEAFALAIEGERGAARDRIEQISSAEALSGRVRWLLQRVLGGEVEATWPGNIDGGNPLELAMAMRLRAHEAEVLLERKGHARAAGLISSVLISELNAPWHASVPALKRWTATMRKAQARHRWHPKGDWSYAEIEVESGDSLTLIRRRFLAQFPDKRICTGLIQRANGMSSDMIHPGQRLRIPTGEVTLLADLDAHWLLYMIDGEVCESWYTGIGAPDDPTITGSFTIGEKEAEPTWFRKGEQPIFYGEEGNALGTHYLAWYADGVKTHYGFHGTWEPESIGKDESAGCIRMANDDVKVLFDITPVGTAFVVQP